MRSLRVTVDHTRCVGNGTCLTIALRTFAHNADRQSVVIDAAGDSPDLILEAAETCPVSAIAVEDAETGARLYP